MAFWADTKVMVAGGAGFLGSWVVDVLIRRGCRDVFVPRRSNYDLRRREDVQRAIEHANPALIIHLAARVGGIGANQARPAEFFYDNAMMGLNVIECCRRFNAQKVVVVGSICG